MRHFEAKKISSMGNQYYFEQEFEYRGHTYWVKYGGNGYTTFKERPAYVQHKEAQASIDELIACPVKLDEKPVKAFDEQEIWDLLGW